MGESRVIGVLVALALSAAPAGAQAADEPLELAPISAWVMDYADDSCALRRAFQAGAEQAVLQLRQYGPGDSFEVSIASTTLQARNEFPRVRFEPDERYRVADDGYYFDTKDGDAILFHTSLFPNATERDPGAEWPEAQRDAREREITGLAVEDGFERPFVLRTGAMHQAMSAMRTCIDELLNHWGLDAAVQRTLSRPVTPFRQERWARYVAAVYPAEQLRKGRSGFVNIRMIVGADGRPTVCIPNQDGPDRAFDEKACEMLMRHARFEPALDANGAPVASFWTTRVLYRLN